MSFTALRSPREYSCTPEMDVLKKTFAGYP